MTQQFMSEDISKLALALSKFQGSIESVSKSASVSAGAYGYKYATLADIQREISEPLKENELSVTQVFLEDEAGGLMQTLLMHSSGQWIKSCLRLGGYKTHQDLGKNITYLRRYCLSSVLGIVTEEDNDCRQEDGGEMPFTPQEKKKAQVPLEKLSDSQSAEIKALIKDLHSQTRDRDQEYTAFNVNLRTILKIKNMDEMKACHFQTAKNALTRKIEEIVRENEEEKNASRMA